MMEEPGIPWISGIWLVYNETAHLSRTKNFPPQSHLTAWFLPEFRPVAPAPQKPSGIRCSHPFMSFGKSRSSGWLHSFLRMLMALRGWESFPRSSALISGEEINSRYSANWKSDSPQKTTCSYLTGTVWTRSQLSLFRKGDRNQRYFESRSLVLRMMNLVTRLPSSFSFFSLSALMRSLASASRPRIIWFSKFLRKSFLVPRKFGLAKLRREKYSERSF